jgi:hypothetical protein
MQTNQHGRRDCLNGRAKELEGTKTQFPARAAEAGIFKIMHLPCKKDKTRRRAEEGTFFMIQQKANINRSSDNDSQGAPRETHTDIAAAGSLPRSYGGLDYNI